MALKVIDLPSLILWCVQSCMAKWIICYGLYVQMERAKQACNVHTCCYGRTFQKFGQTLPPVPVPFERASCHGIVPVDHI